MTHTSEPRPASPVSEAVILMAGTGSRLRTETASLPKPLISLLGRPLITYILETLARAGIKRIHAVTGFESELVMARVRPLVPPELEVNFIYNRDWQKQNGISLLAAAGHVTPPFILSMSDHLFDQLLIDRLLAEAQLDQLNLAVDRKLGSIFDLADATKVRTQDDRVIAIGKELTDYDAIDTGLFVCAQNIFDSLERARKNGDCSLSDGVRLLAAEGKARAVDIGQGWWQDVDTPEMLAYAEKCLLERGRSEVASAGAGATGADRDQD